MSHKCPGYTRFTQELERCRQEQLACLPEIREGCEGAALGCSDWLIEELLIEAEAQQQAQGVGA